MDGILMTVFVLALSLRAASAVEPAAAPDAPVAPPAKQKWTLVELVGRDEKESIQLLESPALSALQDEIKQEERLFDKAMTLTEKVWKEEPSTKTKSFPRSAIGHRSFKVVNTFTSRETADKAFAAAKENVLQTIKNHIESEKKREEARRKMGQNNRNKSFAPKSKQDPKKEDAEKKRLEDQARTIFDTKLADLKSGKPEVKEPMAAAADGKAAGGR